jgi:hypothetical protein
MQMGPQRSSYEKDMNAEAPDSWVVPQLAA